ncbi:MAG: hypothetical protein J7L39_00140 [Candidatus Aenigmarchaeota archaeon]|nr:hypothetical protein [Candidatus Aenigmarchaeota archaeon]
MEIEIIKEKENVLLGRKESEIIIKHPNAPTPKKDDLRKKLAEVFNMDKSQVIISYILGRKGLQESFSKVKILKEKPKEKLKEEKNETQTDES